MNWRGFLEEIRKEPKNFAKAVVDNLNPPKYALEEIKRFEWMCHFCWKPRADVCFLCLRGVCEEHIAKTFVGEKTKLEWYVCEDCLKVHDEKEIYDTVRDQDEEFWLEDQETEKEST